MTYEEIKELCLRIGITLQGFAEHVNEKYTQDIIKYFLDVETELWRARIKLERQLNVK